MISPGKPRLEPERVRSGAGRWGGRWVIPEVLLLAAALGALAPAAETVAPARAASSDPRTVPAPASVGTQLQTEAAAIKREAAAVARELVDAYPDDALTHALLGSAYYNTGQSDLATQHLQKCLAMNPGQADVYEILARIAYEKGNLEESIRLGQEALKRGPANAEVLNRLGRALMDLGKAEEAVATIQQAVRVPPPVSESYYLLGQAQMQAGDFAQAKASFQKAIQLLPDHTQAFFGLFTACTRLGQTDEAGRYREQFLKLESIDRQTLTDRSGREETLSGLPLVRQTVARTLFGAAQIYRAHQQPGKSVDLLRKSASFDPDSPLYRAALEAHFVQGHALPEGVKVFQSLASEQPENGLNYLFLGRLYGRTGQFDAAEQAFGKVQTLVPQWPEGYRALAELYLRTDRKPMEAKKLAQKAVELEPSGPGYYLLALACAKTNDRAGAVEAIEQAIARSPGEKRYRDFLQQLRPTP